MNYRLSAENALKAIDTVTVDVIESPIWFPTVCRDEGKKCAKVLQVCHMHAKPWSA